MKIKAGVVIAWTLSLTVTIWIWSGVGSKQETTENESSQINELSLPSVKSKILTSEPVSQTIVLNGQTKAKRQVKIKSEASGKIEQVYFKKGESVKAGQLLAKISPSDLPSKLKSAKAFEEQKRLEYLATQELNTTGFQNATQLATALSGYEQAKSQTISLQFQLEHTEIRAPFDGIINDRFIEAGSYIRTADPVFELVDFSSLIIEAQISEMDVAKMNLGQNADIELLHGERLIAVVSFINKDANPQTRTYQVEFEIANPEIKVFAGTSATVYLSIAQEQAHFISPALLQLDDQGKLGIKALDNQTVVFYNVNLIESTPSGIWITGLPEQVEIITVGQGYVDNGQMVSATRETNRSN